MNILTILTVAAICLLGFGICISRYRIAQAVPKDERFFHLGLSIAGLLWGLLNLLLLFYELNLFVSFDLEFTHTWIIRPILLITLAFVYSAGEIRRKRPNEPS